MILFLDKLTWQTVILSDFKIIILHTYLQFLINFMDYVHLKKTKKKPFSTNYGQIMKEVLYNVIIHDNHFHTDLGLNSDCWNFFSVHLKAVSLPPIINLNFCLFWIVLLRLKLYFSEEWEFQLFLWIIMEIMFGKNVISKCVIEMQK